MVDGFAIGDPCALRSRSSLDGLVEQALVVSLLSQRNVRLGSIALIATSNRYRLIRADIAL